MSISCNVLLAWWSQTALWLLKAGAAILANMCKQQHGCSTCFTGLFICVVQFTFQQHLKVGLMSLTMVSIMHNMLIDTASMCIEQACQYIHTILGRWQCSASKQLLTVWRHHIVLLLYNHWLYFVYILRIWYLPCVVSWRINWGPTDTSLSILVHPFSLLVYLVRHNASFKKSMLWDNHQMHLGHTQPGSLVLYNNA